MSGAKNDKDRQIHNDLKVTRKRRNCYEAQIGYFNNWEL